MLILYNSIFFKNGLETCNPHSNTDLFCIRSDNSLGGHFETEKKTLQKFTFQDLEHASEVKISPG